MNLEVLTWPSPSQAGQELEVTARRVIQLIEAGRLSCVMTANGRLVDPESIRALKEERRARKEANVELAR